MRSPTFALLLSASLVACSRSNSAGVDASDAAPTDAGGAGEADSRVHAADTSMLDERAPGPIACVVMNPRTPPARVDVNVAEVVRECGADSGDCRASTTCTGRAADRICDEAAFITREAALCVASAAGLANGLDGLTAALVYHYGFRRVVWNVNNRLFDRGSGRVRDGSAVDDYAT